MPGTRAPSAGDQERITCPAASSMASICAGEPVVVVGNSVVVPCRAWQRRAT
jgi:hypothetical protein